MVDLELVYKLFTALAIGLIVGLEREIAQEKTQNVKFAGLRTFGVAGLIGGISAFFASEGYLVLIGALLCITVLLGIAYYRSTGIEQKLGFTTELSLILTYLLGGLSFFVQDVAVIFTIVVTILLAFKKPLHEFTRGIPKEEFFDSLKFALIALVVLPLLPNQTYSVSLGPLGVVEAINPFNIWLIVVFISGISFVGYFLVKWLGAGMGLALTGLVGGLASSTAVTTTMATRTKEVGGMEYAAMISTVLANIVMFGRVVLLVAVLMPSMLVYIYLPLGMMFLAAILVASYFYVKGSKEIVSKEPMKLKSPFSIQPALTFAAFVAIILFVSKAASQLLGSFGLYITAMFAGLADVDAITVSAADIASKGLESLPVAATAIVIAVMVNIAIRVVYAYTFGTRLFGKYTLIMASAVVAAGLAGIVLITAF